MATVTIKLLHLQAGYEIIGCRSQTAMLPAKFWKQPLAKGNSRERSSNRQCIEARPKRFLAPFMIHQDLPTLTETAFDGHPCCVVSVTYVRTHCFHGGNTGSNPVGDANIPKQLASRRFSRQSRSHDGRTIAHKILVPLSRKIYEGQSTSFPMASASGL